VERDERDLADDVDRHWDALLRGEDPTTPSGLDAGLASLVARLHAAGNALPSLFPDPKRAWREVPREPTPSVLVRSDKRTILPAWIHPNGQVDLSAERQFETRTPPRGGGWLLAQLATAALLLLTLAVAFVVMWRPMPDARVEATWRPALVQALASAPGGIVDKPLIEVAFAADDLPSGEREAIYYQLVIPPGASLPYLGGSFCGCRRETISDGVGVEVVQSGAYTLRLEAPLRVQRAGSTRPTEEIPAGAEVTLAAGDAVIYPDYAAPGDIRNAGEQPVTLLGAAIIAAEDSGTPVPQAPKGVEATLLSRSASSDWAALPPGPINLALRQVTLPPRTSVGPYQPVGLQALRIESGMISRSLLRPGDAAPTGPPLVQSAGTTISSPRPSTRLREILDNPGERPAELLALIIEPAMIDAQSIVP
jgi:hypothetical protein